MTDEEINRYVHEAMGLCRHDWGKRILVSDARWVCLKETCDTVGGFAEVGDPIPTPNPNYLEYGEPWGELLNWAMEQKWWEAFKFSQWYNDGGGIGAVIASAQVGLPIELFSNPRSLAEHIVSYLKQEEVNGNTSASS